MGLSAGKILSTSIEKNRAGIELVTCIVEIRKNQNVTAEWINAVGESATPLPGDGVLLAPREQSFGGYLAFGFVDIINQIFSTAGVKVIFGRDSQGKAKTKITLTDSEIVLENPVAAKIELDDNDIILNKGINSAVSAERLQIALTAFSQTIVAEFTRVAAGVLPNPAAPYVPAPILPVDITPAKSETIKLP